MTALTVMVAALAASTATLAEGAEPAAVPIVREDVGSQSQSMLEPVTENMSKRRYESGTFASCFPWEYRTINGAGNNKDHPLWGSARSPMIRKCKAAYGENNSGSGADRPNPRYISSYLMKQDKPNKNSKMATDMVWQWGQFCDHDIVETPAEENDPMDITIPEGDEVFKGSMGMSRSKFNMVDGVREQMNEITAYIDGSNVYGSEEEREHELRMHDGSGKLKTSESKCGPLLPYNENELANADHPHLDKKKFYLAGDVRCNEQTNLICMHTLWVREHNWWAHQIKMSDPKISGDEIYQMAKVIVCALMQKITYYDWLPVMLGDDIPPYTGYKKDVNPGMINEFAAIAFRVGHTMLSPDVTRMGKCDTKIEGSIKLKDAFFAPGKIPEFCLEPYMRAQCNTPCEEIDHRVIDDVQNFLFHNVSDHGFDLCSLNIQRGRDHGHPGYNDIRETFGLKRHSSWDEFPASEYGLKEKLEHLYPSPDYCDGWVCMLCEKHMPGAMVGETMKAIMMEQFMNLRDGDRFYYEDYLSDSGDCDLLSMIKETTLYDVIARNTHLGKGTLSKNVFFVPGHYGH